MAENENAPAPESQLELPGTEELDDSKPAPIEKPEKGEEKPAGQPPVDEKERTASMVRGAQEALRKAAEERKAAQAAQAQVQQILDQLRQRPDFALKSAGLSEEQLTQFAEGLLVQEMLRKGIDPRTGRPMDPATAAQYRAQVERQQFEEQRTTFERQQREQQQEQLKQVVRQKLDEEMTTALSEAKLPPTPGVLARLATAVLDLDMEVSPRELAGLVRQDIEREIAATLDAMPIEMAVTLLPKGFVEKLRKMDLDTVKRGHQGLPTTQARVIPGNSKVERPNSNKKLSVKEAMDELEAWASRGR